MSFKGLALDDIAKACHAEWVGSPYGQLIYHFAFDSRRILHPSQTLFAAIQTKQNDGHRYITSLISKGVRCFLVSQTKDLPSAPDVVYLKVNDTLKALQDIAVFYRTKLQGKVIGITGSNGKTIVKEWFYELVSSFNKVNRSPGSFNSQLGVPISLLSFDAQADFSVVEAGVSKPGEMIQLQKIIQPEIGIFTCIGDAHNENFESISQKINEKLNLFEGSTHLIVSADHTQIIEHITKRGWTNKLVKWGVSSLCFLQIIEERVTQNGFQLKLKTGNDSFDLLLPFADKASRENALHAICLGLLLNADRAFINGVKNLKSLSMRLEQKKGINKCIVLDDTYSADLQSLQNALSKLSLLPYADKTVILSDFFEIGSDDNELCEKISELINQYGVRNCIVIGERFSAYQHVWPAYTSFYLSTEAFLQSFPALKFFNQAILIKGARVFEFERISELFQEQVHETCLEIDLSKLRDNIAYYKSQLPQGIKIMAMIKAMGYGTGSVDLAYYLEQMGINYLAVAFTDEGIALRQAGVRLPIMVMNPEEASIAQLVRYRLEPEIYCFRILNRFIEFISAHPEQFTEPLNAHIKFNTGMNRLGFEPFDVQQLLSILKTQPLLNVVSVFSHLAAADDLSEKEFTLNQIKTLKHLGLLFKNELSTSILLHILNTSGIEHYSEGIFDMVRIGIGMYGVSKASLQLQLICTLKSRITQLRLVKAGSSVGYSRKNILTRDSIIATVPIGYADGLPRKLKQTGYKPKINGHEVEFAGNICMDMCMLDVTDLVNIKEGDEVEFFSSKEDLFRIAKELNTIPYEILAQLSSRVKRVFIQ